MLYSYYFYELKQRIKSINRKVKKKDEELDEAIFLKISKRIGLVKFDEIKNKIESEKSVLLKKLEIEEQKLQTKANQYNVLQFIQQFSKGILSFARNASNSEKRAVIEMLIEKIEIDYIEEKKDHEIFIKLKIPLFEENQYESKQLITVRKPKLLEEKSPPHYNKVASVTV